MRMLIRIMAVILFIVGFGFFSYPIVLKESFDKQTVNTIEEFEQLKSAGLKRVENDSSNNEETASQKPIPYADLRMAMFDYNDRLFRNRQSGLIDQLSYEQPDFLLSDYGVDTNILGYITIPDIDIKLPIYNGASKENMTKGATYLANTSLPVGGENTNCVIAAHSRYKNIYMFKEITQLKEGDEIRITNLWETLVYKVVETRIIAPDDSKNIYIQPGRSLVTLSTCHPYPDNYQRYLVYGELVKNVSYNRVFE